MQRFEPQIDVLGDFRLKIYYWVNEYDQRPYYSHALFYKNESVMVLPYMNKQLTIQQAIGMYQARQMSDRHFKGE